MNEKWSQKYKRSIDCNNPKGFSQRAHCQSRKKRNESNMNEEPRIARKPGQKANSKKHSDLFTDENPKGTIHGLGFKNVEIAKNSVSKIESSGKSHAHKIQAAIAMEQRARSMNKNSEAAVFRGFIEKMKEKTKKNEMKIEEKLQLFLEKNCPTNPAKWSASKAAAKRKFDVYPSAYANGWAAKNYKSKGGGWKTCAKKESYDPAMGGWVQPSNKVAIENPFGDDDKLNEGGCWEGYKQVGMKEKNGKQVPNCVPVNENKNMKKLKEEYPDHPERRDKDSEIDYGYVQPEEYDVDNHDDYKDFITFMREYTKTLNEADCGCVFEAEYQGRKVKLGKPMQGDVKKFKVYVKNDKGNVVKVNFGDPNMRIKKSNPERRKSFRARHNCDSPGPRWKARYWSCRKW